MYFVKLINILGSMALKCPINQILLKNKSFFQVFWN